jgi:hypothetical protein
MKISWLPFHYGISDIHCTVKNLLVTIYALLLKLLDMCSVQVVHKRWSCASSCARTVMQLMKILLVLFPCQRSTSALAHSLLSCLAGFCTPQWHTWWMQDEEHNCNKTHTMTFCLWTKPISAPDVEYNIWFVF